MHVGEENRSNFNSNKFLTQRPQEIIKSGNYAKVPFIAGVMDTEGLIVAACKLFVAMATVVTVNVFPNRYFGLV